MTEYSWNLELDAKEIVCLLNLLKYLQGKIETTEATCGTRMFTAILFEQYDETMQELLTKVERIV